MQDNNQMLMLSPKDFETQMKLMNLPEAFKNTAKFLLQFNLQNGPLLEHFQLGLTSALSKIEGKTVIINQDMIETIQGKAVDLKIDPEKNELTFKLVEHNATTEAQKIIS